SMAVHKSSRTSDRLAPFAIISSLRFSAANRDSACDGVVVFGPCFDSHSAGRTTLAALLNCVPWSGLRRDSGEFIIFSLLGSAFMLCSNCAVRARSHWLLMIVNSAEENPMKRLLPLAFSVTVAATCFAVSTFAQGGARGASKLTLHGTTVSVEYGRPALKGRSVNDLP